MNDADTLYAALKKLDGHSTLKMTPAMAAGVTGEIWQFEDLLAALGGVASGTNETGRDGSAAPFSLRPPGMMPAGAPPPIHPLVGRTAGEPAVVSNDAPDGVRAPRRRRPFDVIGCLLAIALAPYLAAFAAVMAMMLMEVLTGVGGARWDGYREAGAYFIMDGKPPVPRAVPAAQWWVSYALETTVTYGLRVTLIEGVVVFVAMASAKGLASLRRVARRP